VWHVNGCRDKRQLFFSSETQQNNKHKRQKSKTIANKYRIFQENNHGEIFVVHSAVFGK